MDCAAIQHELRAGRPLGAAAPAHLAGCPACTELVRAAPRMPRPQPVEAEARDGALWQATVAELEHQVGPAAWLRERRSGVRVALALLVASLVPLAVVVSMPRSDLGSYPTLRMVLELAALALAAVVAAWACLRPLQRAASPTLAGFAVALAWLGAATIASIPPRHGAAPHELADASTFVIQALGCLVFGTLCAVPTWIVLRLLAREGAALGGRAPLLACAAFVVGMAAVLLHCPQLHAGHLWLGHVGIAIPLLAWAWVRSRS